MATNFFSGIAWYYGGNNFIIRTFETFDFISHSDAAHVTCSIDSYVFSW